MAFQNQNNIHRKNYPMFRLACCAKMILKVMKDPPLSSKLQLFWLPAHFRIHFSVPTWFLKLSEGIHTSECLTNSFPDRRTVMSFEF